MTNIVPLHEREREMKKSQNKLHHHTLLVSSVSLKKKLLFVFKAILRLSKNHFEREKSQQA